MQIKLIELRDKATFIPAIAIKLNPRSETEHFLMGRAGYGEENDLVLFGRLSGDDKLCYDPFAWGDRTFHAAHNYVTNNWDRIVSGQVVDVEFIKGETEEPKKSELEDSYNSIEERQHVDD